MAEENVNIESEQLDTPYISPAEQLMIINDTAKWLEVMEREEPDMIYFLDKSARPLYWLLKRVYKRKDGSFPQIRFLNIGEEKTGGFELVLENSDFPELSASKKFHPAKVMVVDEKSHSGESLEKGARVVQRLYDIEQEQIVKYSVLSAFPSWIRQSEMIGVTDPTDKEHNPLSRPAPSKEASRKLRRELDQLAPSIEMFRKKTKQFRKVEEEVERKSHDNLVEYELPLDTPLIWDNKQRLFTCVAGFVKKVADGVRSGKIDISEGMRLYYLFEYNQIHPDDWQTGDYFDLKSPSLNYLAESIMGQLS